jgi:hypothetical protein
MSASRRQALRRGRPPTNPQTKRSKLPNSFWTVRNARALAIAAEI